MKYVLLMILTINSYAMSFHSAEKVFNVMSQEFRNRPSIHILDESTINAYSWHNQVEISEGLLTLITNEDEMAFVLGHELGHLLLGHNGSTKENEYQADRASFFLMKRYGFNTCRGAKNLFKLVNAESDDHPLPSKRYERLCGDK